MRKLLGVGTVVLGVAGVLLCATAFGIGWWAAARIVDRIGLAAARLDQGLFETDARLSRVELRMNTVRSELDQARVGAEAIVAENPELPRVRARTEQILDRLVPAIDRADAIAESLQSVAAGLRTAADVADQLNDDGGGSVRVRNAADTIDRAAEALDGLQTRVEAVKSDKAVQSIRDLVDLARAAVASSERLAEGLATVRRVIAVVRERTAEWRGEVVFWAYAAATANAIVWLWSGLGQLCLIGWGRRWLGGRTATG
jgi:hypothetical protein